VNPVQLAPMYLEALAWATEQRSTREDVRRSAM
jgi:hypothetical protein